MEFKIQIFKKIQYSKIEKLSLIEETLLEFLKNKKCSIWHTIRFFTW